jgi:hypothetical protein
MQHTLNHCLVHGFGIACETATENLQNPRTMGAALHGSESSGSAVSDLEPLT